MKCAVKGCTSSRRNKNEKKTFFMFPRDQYLLKKWLEFCKNKNTFKPKSWRICIDHFKDEDIQGSGMYGMGLAIKRTLIPRAIPCRYNAVDDPSEQRAKRLQAREIKKFVNSVLTNVNQYKKKIRKQSKVAEDAPVLNKEHLPVKGWDSLCWICYYCKNIFQTYSKLRAHQESSHSDVDRAEIYYECYDCKESILGYSLFLNHIRNVHHDVLKLCCDVCSEVLLDYEKLSIHREKHTEISDLAQPPVYHCTLCEKVHHSEKLLKDHFRESHTFTYSEITIVNGADAYEMKSSTDECGEIDQIISRGTLHEFTNVKKEDFCSEKQTTEIIEEFISVNEIKEEEFISLK